MRAILIDGPNDLYTTEISDPNTHILFTLAPQSLNFKAFEQSNPIAPIFVERCVYEKFAENKHVALYRYIRTES